MIQKRLQLFRSLLFGLDLLVVAASWLAAYYWRFYLPIIPVTKGIPPLTLYLHLLVLVVGVFAVVLPAMGLYRRPWQGLAQALWPVVRAVTMAVVVAVSLTYFVNPYEFSRLVFLKFWFLCVVALTLCRPLMQWLWRKSYPARAGEGVVIVGDGELGIQVARNLRRHPELGFKLVGFLGRGAKGQILEGAPVLGGYEDLADVVASGQVQVVLLALPLEDHGQIPAILEAIGEEMVSIAFVPDVYRFVTLRGSVEELEGMALVGLCTSPLEGWARVLKRAVDLVGAGVGLVVLSPLMLAIAVGVKLSSPGPVLYRQRRVGMDGREFTMLKFRSMYPDAEERTGPVWAKADDPRCTPIGRFLRRWSLDELPQLINVLKGEMSLVGPRPERPEFIAEFRKRVPKYMLRHKIKAGMTGWAQIHGWRGDTDLNKRIEYDLEYIKNWSVWLDIKIIWLTLWRGWRDPNAR